MMRSTGRRLLPLVLVLVASAPAFAQSTARSTSPGPPWWRSERFKKDLGLTPEQSARIGAVFQSTMPQLRQGYDDLDRLENKLSRLIETNVEEALVIQQIDRVEAARSSLNKTRTLMHLHMRQVMTSEQRLRFKALYEQFQADRQVQPRKRPEP